MYSLIFYVTFVTQDRDLPGRVVRAVADAVRENWREPKAGGPPVPHVAVPVQRLVEAWSDPMRDSPAEEFEFSPFTYRRMSIRLHRQSGKLHVVFSVTERAFSDSPTFEGSYYYRILQNATGRDGEGRWADTYEAFQDRWEREADGPTPADRVRHLDRVVLSVMDAGPSEGPYNISDGPLDHPYREHTALPLEWPTVSVPRWR